MSSGLGALPEESATWVPSTGGDEGVAVRSCNAMHHTHNDDCRDELDPD